MQLFCLDVKESSLFICYIYCTRLCFTSNTNGNDKDLRLHLIVNKLSCNVSNLLYLIACMQRRIVIKLVPPDKSSDRKIPFLKNAYSIFNLHDSCSLQNIQWCLFIPLCIFLTQGDPVGAICLGIAKNVCCIAPNKMGIVNYYWNINVI